MWLNLVSIKLFFPSKFIFLLRTYTLRKLSLIRNTAFREESQLIGTETWNNWIVPTTADSLYSSSNDFKADTCVSMTQVETEPRNPPCASSCLQLTAVLTWGDRVSVGLMEAPSCTAPFLLLFSGFSWSLTFDSLIRIRLDVDCFEFIPFGVFWASWMCSFMFSLTLGHTVDDS